MLRWAREEAGYDQSEIAEKVKITADDYVRWEKEGKNIPLGKLKTLANTYKRQLAVFLLPTVPERLPKPKDFRNLKPADSKLSKKSLQVIRDVTYFRQIALELEGKDYWSSRYAWLTNKQKKALDSDTFSLQLRELLDITIEDQMNWLSESEAYRKWRLAVERRLGIFVFQFPMSMDEVHGFCFSDFYPFAIVTNSNHSYTGRIFTIFHELAHIFRFQSGMCLVEQVTERQVEEWTCNQFAGKFLAPSDLIEPAADLTTISKYASKLNISREVYLRRLREENKISEMKFFQLLDQIKATYRKTTKKGGPVKPEVKSRASRGETFYGMVLEALYNNRISYARASSALDLNVTRLLHEV